MTSSAVSQGTGWRMPRTRMSGTCRRSCEGRLGLKTFWARAPPRIEWFPPTLTTLLSPSGTTITWCGRPPTMATLCMLGLIHFPVRSGVGKSTPSALSRLRGPPSRPSGQV
jgi:hypothetical protein